ncbi:methyltransferase domain-containing protein [Deinococcus radiopugnans]|uniref:23S rRNA G2445 N2-methylase RlmL n=1 Tax=Deinococcus radiopugnans ATCC 19172 TaxID=585398 RepID=A0A5C4XXM2_9DEIO|nr:methyltransferase domain-containing protein [Deinococcus radiopugnans]MBB6018117.1 23S rRNA G2445 N2-methylase RlmL [Deinococcus radiopugnans ATCC 19172]TNM68278.1 methyltransferase domain-containing protein [Deinococcus radiopugnans ATCC 19172]
MPRPPRPDRFQPAGKRKSRPKVDHRARQPAHEYELEVLPGLEHVAATELGTVPLARDIRGLRFWFPGDPERLTRLRSALAVYRVRTWDVPRPRGLLGHQQLGELTEFLRGVLAVGGQTSFRLGAAGKESAVMQRLAEELETALGLSHRPEDGQLLIRLRPEADGPGWEVLARTTPRPLSARPWRVCNMHGGLNATLAYATHKLAGQRDVDRIFNPMCGSGTLLIERDLLGPSDALVGVDIEQSSVDCARTNIQAAGRDIEVARIDALHTDLPARSFDLIVADLPWGDAIGTHGGNSALYPAFLQEMHRLLSRQGRMAVITHEIRLFEGLLTGSAQWNARELLQVASGGHNPKVYLLNRR